MRSVSGGKRDWVFHLAIVVTVVTVMFTFANIVMGDPPARGIQSAEGGVCK